jgi:glycosyltransferase involved in cell wall biosynthesis
MRRASTHLSVVVGCYNAARHLERRMRQLLAFLDGIGREYEVLIVEDGSLDDSLPILRRLEAEVPSITVLHNPRNMGKGYSIRNGILNSRGKYIIFTDVDMTYSMRNVLSVLERLESGAPLVVGNRRLPESVYVVNNALGEVCVSPPPRRSGVQRAGAPAVRAGDTGHAKRLEGILEGRRGAHLFTSLYRRLPVRHRDFHSKPNARHTCRRRSSPIDLRRRRHDGAAVSSVVQRDSRSLFTSRCWSCAVRTSRASAARPTRRSRTAESDKAAASSWSQGR